MSTEQHKALVRRFIEAAWNEGDLTAVDALLAPTFVDHSAAPGAAADREAFKQGLVRTRTAFPDFHVTIEELFGEDDKVVARFTAEGTHQAVWEHPIVGRIGSTGQRTSWTGMRIFALAAGQVTTTWVEVDRLRLMQQLGAVALTHAAG